MLQLTFGTIPRFWLTGGFGNNEGSVNADVDPDGEWIKHGDLCKKLCIEP
jgi:hypothetical protein